VSERLERIEMDGRRKEKRNKKKLIDDALHPPCRALQ
jgi:hypothetical protein